MAMATDAWQGDEELTSSERGWVLLGAIGSDDVEACLASLKAGAPALFESGLTPLCKAAEWNSARCAAAMMAVGEDWQTLDSSGNNALERAAQAGSLSCVEAILASGLVEPGMAGSALPMVAARGEPVCVGVIARHVGWDGEGAVWSWRGLAAAAQSGSRACVEVILEGKPGSQWDPAYAAEVLANACSIKNSGPLASLLEAGWDANARVNRFDLAAMRYMASGEIPFGPAQRVDEAGSLAALDWAIRCEAWDCARLLISAGAKPCFCHEGGATALARAAMGQSASLAKLLIELGVDPNRKGAMGGTALLWASQFNMMVGNAAVTRVLLAAGADPFEKGGSDWDALGWFMDRYSVEQDVEALCDVVDPRPRMERAKRRGWTLPSGESIGPSVEAVLLQAASMWDRRDAVARERAQIEQSTAGPSRQASSVRL